MKQKYPVVWCHSIPEMFNQRVKRIVLLPKDVCPFCSEMHTYSWDMMRLINPDGSIAPMLYAYSYCGLGRIILKVRQYRRVKPVGKELLP